MIQMRMLWLTLFLKREKKSSTKCKPNKNGENENGQENLLPKSFGILRIHFFSFCLILKMPVQCQKLSSLNMDTYRDMNTLNRSQAHKLSSFNVLIDVL